MSLIFLLCSLWLPGNLSSFFSAVTSPLYIIGPLMPLALTCACSWLFSGFDQLPMWFLFVYLLVFVCLFVAILVVTFLRTSGDRGDDKGS